MPFTFAHPAYAAPIKFLSPMHWSITGLVLGSMSPDYEYFLMLEPYQNIGHTLTGLFVQAIPLSILFAFLFHCIVKETAAAHLPSLYRLNHRACHLSRKWGLRGWGDWVRFLVSVVVGFMTHIGIDALTHAHGYFVLHISLLRMETIGSLPLYKLLQYSLSLFGVVALAATILFRLITSDPAGTEAPVVSSKQKLYFWITASVIALAVTVVKLIWTDSSNVVGIIVVSPISGFCLGLLISSILAKKLRLTESRTRQF